tara:strand:+ start:1744 stop:2217 length:474 start_codon:yes stop_codon:yes gene_type:complete
MNEEEIQTLARDTAKKHINNLADQLETGEFNFDAHAGGNTEPPPAQREYKRPSPEEFGKIMSESLTMRCDKCSGCLFNIVHIVKMVPAEISPNKEKTAVPIQVYRCAECNYISEDMMPTKVLVDVDIDKIVNRGYKEIRTTRTKSKSRKKTKVAAKR